MLTLALLEQYPALEDLRVDVLHVETLELQK
jgi:hypothetical protein